MITIRPYHSRDATALWHLFVNTVHHINAKHYSPAQLAAWAPTITDLTLWQHKMDSLSPFIAQIDDVIVGYADLQQDGLIDHFFCHYRYQRQGVGRALMAHIINVGRKKQITRYYSAVSISARPFYEQMGFTVTHSQLVEVRGEKLQNFIMERDDFLLSK